MGNKYAGVALWGVASFIGVPISVITLPLGQFIWLLYLHGAFGFSAFVLLYAIFCIVVVRGVLWIWVARGMIPGDTVFECSVHFLYSGALAVVTLMVFHPRPLDELLRLKMEDFREPFSAFVILTFVYWFFLSKWGRRMKGTTVHPSGE